MDTVKTLDKLKVGKTAYIDKLLNTGEIKRRLLDIGLVENTKVECVGISPFGDPKAFLIRGAVIALRAEDSGKILICDVTG